MIIFIKKKLRATHRFENLYRDLILFKFQELVGRLRIVFFKCIYSPHAFQIGMNGKVWGKVEIMIFKGGQLRIGDDFHWVSNSGRAAIALYSPCKFTVLPKGKIEIGKHVGLNGTALVSRKGISIGDDTMIAPNVTIVDSDFHKIWPPESRWFADCSNEDEAVSIGKRVWIGMNSLILKGSKIGDNSVIGAGSVVKGVFPENVIIAGNPARVVKKLGEKHSEVCMEDSCQ